MSHVHEPIAPQLAGKEWPDCRILVGYELDRNATNWHNLREQTNAFFLGEAVRQKAEEIDRATDLKHFHDKCDRMEAAREADNKAHDNAVSTVLLRLGLLEGKVINYTSITAVIVSAVTTIVVAWLAKKF